MFTLERKVDLILRYIATTDKTQRDELKKLVVEALKSDGAPAHNTPDVEDMVVDLLKELGMHQHLIGYDYAVYGIKIAISNRDLLKNLTKGLYLEVAERFDTTASCVERRIRSSVEDLFISGDLGAINRVFGNAVSPYRAKLTSGEFLTSCANEVSRRMKNITKV